MSLFLPTALLSLSFLATVPGPTLADERHIELTADPPSQSWEVRIGPNQASNLMFNAPLRRGSVTVQERESFHSVMVDERAGLITLLPSDKVAPGTTLVMAVGFADNSLPENTTFRLVVHAGQGERQVRVDRKSRSAASFQEEARRERARAEHCETLPARQGGTACEGGLVGMFDAGLVKKGIGIRALDFHPRIPSPAPDGLLVEEAYGYRAIGRVAVELWLAEPEKTPWRLESAELLTPEGHSVKVLRIWQAPGMLSPGDVRQIVVEAEAPASRGPFVLRLSEPGGARTLTVDGVMFP